MPSTPRIQLKCTLNNIFEVIKQKNPTELPFNFSIAEIDVDFLFWDSAVWAAVLLVFSRFGRRKLWFTDKSHDLRDIAIPNHNMTTTHFSYKEIHEMNQKIESKKQSAVQLQ